MEKHEKITIEMVRRVLLLYYGEACLIDYDDDDQLLRADLYRDFGFDSLDLCEFYMNFEKEFGMTIADEDEQKTKISEIVQIKPL